MRCHRHLRIRRRRALCSGHEFLFARAAQTHRGTSVCVHEWTEARCPREHPRRLRANTHAHGHACMRSRTVCTSNRTCAHLLMSTISVAVPRTCMERGKGVFLVCDRRQKAMAPSLEDRLSSNVVEQRETAEESAGSAGSMSPTSSGCHFVEGLWLCIGGGLCWARGCWPGCALPDPLICFSPWSSPSTVTSYVACVCSVLGCS